MILNKVFPWVVSNLRNFALAARTKDNSTFWHLRYRHLHMKKGLKPPRDKGMAFGLLKLIDKFMRRMHLWQQTRKAYSIRKAKRVSNCLELIHVIYVDKYKLNPLVGVFIFIQTFEKFQNFKVTWRTKVVATSKFFT